MIKTLLIDDELHSIHSLRHDLNLYCPLVSIIGESLSGQEGLQAIQQLRPDLIFLDINMPDLNGLELLKHLGNHRNFQVIFTTAYDQYMLHALRASAIDYLLKPIDCQELIAAEERARLQITKIHQMDDRISNLLQNSLEKEENKRIALPNRNGYEFIRAMDIVSCKAEGSYTIITLKEGREIVLSKPLGETETMLPQNLFIRIHHSTTVNKNEIRELRKNSGLSLRMSNGQEYMVARSRREQLLQELGLK